MSAVLFPRYLGSKSIFSAQKRGNGSSERVLFLGEDFILETFINPALVKSFNENYQVANLTFQDNFILFKIVEYVQKKFGYMFKDIKENKENLIKFYQKDFKNFNNDKDLIKYFKKQTSISFKLGREDYFSFSIKVNELIKLLGVTNETKTRQSILSSFIYLYSLDLKFYEIKEVALKELQKIKRGKNYAVYINELEEWFKLHKNDLNYFTLHFRKFIDKLSIKKNERREIEIECSINKIFLEVLAANKISFKHFELEPLQKIKGNSAKLLYIHLYFANKKILTKEYLFDILDLSKKSLPKDKLKTLKNAFTELKKFGIDTEYKEGKFYIDNKNLKEKESKNGLRKNQRKKQRNTKKNYKEV